MKFKGCEKCLANGKFKTLGCKLKKFCDKPILKKGKK